MSRRASLHIDLIRSEARSAGQKGKRFYGENADGNYRHGWIAHGTLGGVTDWGSRGRPGSGTWFCGTGFDSISQNEVRSRWVTRIWIARQVSQDEAAISQNALSQISEEEVFQLFNGI
jgi:hypothetical protein